MTPDDMHAHLREYLRLRRALGFTLSWPGHILPQFVDWMAAAGYSTITADAAVTWAQLRADAQPITGSHRLGAVRGFARYLTAIDPATEIPPTGVFAAQRRHLPYIYTPQQIIDLVSVAGRLQPAWRAATYQPFFGLLAATGARVGEVLQLSDADADLTGGILHIRHNKSNRERLVPLHPTVTQELRGYVAHRDRWCRHAGVDTFFVSGTGRPLSYSAVHDAFVALLTTAGLPTAVGTRPRIHDLRHAKVVNTLIDWHRDGGDVAARLPILSTYLGHVSPASTFWYITAVPELLQLAAENLNRHQIGGRS